MNKPMLLVVPLLAISFVFAACENNQNTTSLVEGEEAAQVGKDTEPDHVPPEFKSMANPSFIKIDSDTLYRYWFDHAYTKVCWNDCEQNNRFNHMDIHAADVEVGDKLQIDWHQMDPRPSEVNLIQVDKRQKKKWTKKIRIIEILHYISQLKKTWSENNTPLNFCGLMKGSFKEKAFWPISLSRK
jgi:hypothetical protein